MAGQGTAQGGHGADAALAGGVDVAADVQPVLSDVLAGQPAGDLLLGLRGAQVALGDVVRGPDPDVEAEPGHVGFPVMAELQQVPAGVLAGGALRAGDAGKVGQPGQDGVAELADQPVPGWWRDLGLPGAAGGVPGADQPAQRALGLDGPDRIRPVLRRVLEVPY